MSTVLRNYNHCLLLHKWLRVINNTMLFKTVIPQRNKAVLKLKQYWMCCYVNLICILINVYEDVYPLFNQEATKKTGQL